MIAKFKSESSLDGWEVRQGSYFQDVVTTKYDGGMDATFEFTENGNAVFSGISEGYQWTIQNRFCKIVAVYIF